jgi:hypothetical protein
MATTLCWICGAPATTREHKTKRTDLQAVLGQPTQQRPVFVTDRNKMNRRVGSLKANILKSTSLICQDCNSARTQRHDFAWERMSRALRNRHPPLKPGSVVRADKIFAYDTTTQMRDMHLYFVKLLGCHFKETSTQVDIASLGWAILQNKAHPRVWLKFGIGAPLSGSL